MAQDSKRPLKIIAGADSFGSSLKDALVAHLRSLNIDVEDIGTGKYYSVGEEVGRRVSAAAGHNSSSGVETRGLVACGTGVGVSIFANKFPGVYAAACLTANDAVNTRSINNCNVLAVSGMSTAADAGVEILDTWLQTPFKSPCPASGNTAWPPEIDSFLSDSVSEMSKIGSDPPTIEKPEPSTISDVGSDIGSDRTRNKEPVTCAICCLARNREFTPVEIMPGGSMKIVRESPTSAIVRFKAGSVEPAHHHTFGHDLVVMNGKKRVWNLTKEEKYDLVTGDFLFTPAGDVHRVKYFEDTEFFIRWDGDWDIFLDEDLAAANAAVDKASGGK